MCLLPPSFKEPTVEEEPQIPDDLVDDVGDLNEDEGKSQ
jgi:hypothetical protein